MNKTPSSQLSELKVRVRKGRAWLQLNEKDPNYTDNLKLYQSLVDQVIEYGSTEKECWSYYPEGKTVDELSEQEIIIEIDK
jgi:uncharacterized protein YdhG (YjbR/CyaY superfamily)